MPDTHPDSPAAPPDYWGGREHPDTWRAAALERIERLRKGNLRIIVVDRNGRPVPGAEVRVDQQRHAFKFGVAGPARRLVDSTDPDNLRYQQEVARLFNTFTFENDLKWASANLPAVDQAVAWLQARDFSIRGHCLLWGSYQHLDKTARELRGAELLAAMRTHVTEFAAHMRGKLYLWDVVNEAGSNTEVWDSVGWEAFGDSFRWARAADPDARLCYNDYGIINESPEYRAQVAARIRDLLDRDAPVDVLGIQGHMNLPLTPVSRVLEIMDEWAAFGKDLEITEFDLGLWDDEAHARYLADVMTAALSHPKMTAFIQWGLWEGSHWRAKEGGALLRRDWSPRPALAAYEDLVFNQWWTRWQGATDDQGSAALRAFHGAHKVTVAAGRDETSALVDLAPGQEGVVEVRAPD